MERALQVRKGLESYRGRYTYMGISEDGELSQENTTERLIEFQAPDRTHAKINIRRATESGPTTSSVEHYWIGQTHYLQNVMDGTWGAVYVPLEVMPEAPDALEVMLSDSRIVDGLELLTDEELAGEKMFVVSATVPSGIELGFGEPNKMRRIEHWITQEDYFTTTMTYTSGGFAGQEGSLITYTFSDFNAPLEVIPPDATAVPLPMD